MAEEEEQTKKEETREKITQKNLCRCLCLCACFLLLSGLVLAFSMVPCVPCVPCVCMCCLVGDTGVLKKNPKAAQKERKKICLPLLVALVCVSVGCMSVYVLYGMEGKEQHMGRGW